MNRSKAILKVMKALKVRKGLCCVPLLLGQAAALFGIFRAFSF